MTTKTPHVCPWWLGFLLINPFRKFYHNPEQLLAPYLKPGMKAVDYGCAMGYFTLPMARMVGENGQVYGIDIQPKMISLLARRAIKAHLFRIIRPFLIKDNTLPDEITGQIDFVLLFAMVHEVPDKSRLFETVYAMLKPGGRILFAEPSGHVSLQSFQQSVLMAGSAGLKVSENIRVRGSHAVVLMKASL